MVRNSPKSQGRSLWGKARARVVVALILFSVGSGLSLIARAQNDAVGLTGVDRPDDVVMARQVLMEGIQEEMMVLELAAEGREARLNVLQSRAYSMNRLLIAFPHLFPPQTKPPADGSASSTAASLAIWTNFEDFYGKVMASAATALEASQAADMDKFKGLVQQLRVACDSCHAQYMRVSSPSPP